MKHDVQALRAGLANNSKSLKSLNLDNWKLVETAELASFLVWYRC